MVVRELILYQGFVSLTIVLHHVSTVIAKTKQKQLNTLTVH